MVPKAALPCPSDGEKKAAPIVKKGEWIVAEVVAGIIVMAILFSLFLLSPLPPDPSFTFLP